LSRIKWAKRDTVLVVVGAVIGAVLSVGGTYFLAPSQEEEVQQALERERDAQDQKTPPVTVRGVSGGSAADGSYASDSSIPLNGVTPPMNGSSADIASVLPDAVPVHVPPSFTEGASSGATTYIGFTLKGQHHKTVRITDINVVVINRKPAPGATFVYPQLTEHTSGLVPNVRLGFDLDSPDTSARVLDALGSRADSHYFDENTVTLKEDESLGFNVKVATSDCSCTYDLEVHFDDGKTVTIDQATGNDRLFTLTAVRPNYQHYYVPQSLPSTNQAVLVECSSFAECRDMAH
jgi:hypothetical protein